ncbi:leucine Rich Repeat family protein [Wuchereria bancrofti]|uniref:Leucine Rich Repeat family protein n=1 Tax=Wuchereria bancrofti TaxID=6293 RepID=J9FFR7_WUCBA|nr:leucine Rich Repeat family protein [Wuchereria bancrofti]
MKQVQIQNILIYSYLLFTLLLLSVVETQQPDSLSGCPALSAIANADSYNGSFCFCNVRDSGHVHINCLYSSTLEQFKKALLAVSAAKKTVEQVTLSRVKFDAGVLPGKIFDNPYAPIQIISIDKCAERTPLNIHDDSFHGLAEHLQELYITDCNLEQFPQKAIQNLTKLRVLSLAYNKLTNLVRTDFQALQHVEILNLEGNFISSLENGTLSVLRNSLKKLSIGNHNSLNDIFNEISQLKELEVLDMGRADGITNITDGTFGELNKLEKLLLPECSLTFIHKNTFQGLTKLTELDLRINLLNEVECGSFVWTPSLQRLSLAGNYLNESLACWWDGLEHLKELDLGWNEFSFLENNAFYKLGPTLNFLNLRHNKRLMHANKQVSLNQIDENAFNGLSNLRRLNMSETSITEFNKILKHLPSLKELDLSNGKLQQIDESDLEAQNGRLEELILRNNQLTTLPRSVLENMKNLRLLDLSNNKWLCDENMEAVVEEIELKYKEAVLLDQDFILLHANETNCNRPNSLQGQAIMNVIKDSFKMYNSSDDAIYSTISTMSTVDNDLKLEDISTGLLDKFLAKGGLIGDENAKSDHHQNTSSIVHALYHVDMKTELVSEQTKTNPTPIIAVVITLTIISTAIIVAVTRHLRKQKSRVRKRTTFEMRDKIVTNDAKLKKHSNLHEVAKDNV